MAATALRELSIEHRSEDPNVELSSEHKSRILLELTKVLESRHFKGSKRCSDFLEYAVTEALKGNLSQLKERTLGIELFNRRVDYDTNSDPVVRATAGEIRKKIAQHYQESVPGPVQIALPVGTYVPRFEIRGEREQSDAAREGQSGGDGSAAETGIENDKAAVSDLNDQPRHLRAIALSAAIAVLLVCIFLFYHLKFAGASAKAAQQDAGSALTVFWRPFVSASTDTVAVFSDVRSRPKGNLNSKFPTELSTGKMASPGISGVGEVMGVHALDEDFASFHRALRAKRSNFFTFDDALNENVIFLGSPLANPPMRLLQTNRNFVFEMASDESGGSRLALVNLRPKDGEAKLFMPTPNELPIKDDYALIALAPGIHPDRRILILAGITTFGTQAAAEFVSRPDLLKSLVSRLKFSASGEIEPFEAVISVKIDDEVPVDERIVTIRQD